MRVLPRSIDISEAHRDGFLVVHPAVIGEVILDAQLGDRVRRFGILGERLDVGRRVEVAVEHTACRGEHDARLRRRLLNASIRLSVPRMLIVASLMGSATLCRTSICDARWTITSKRPLRTISANSVEFTPSSWNFAAGGMFSAFPVERSSTMTTSSLSRERAQRRGNR